MYLWVLWLVVILVLSFLEISTINLVSVWFVVSALVSLILSLFDVPFIVQFAVFVILGVILMITTKPLLVKYIKPKEVKTNIDRVIGMSGIVTESILKNKVGEVKVDGKCWSATSEEEILEGQEVIIDCIEGVKLRVHKSELKESD